MSWSQRKETKLVDAARSVAHLSKCQAAWELSAAQMITIADIRLESPIGVLVPDLIVSVRGRLLLLDHVPFWGVRDLERKLQDFRDYYNHGRVHASLEGATPIRPQRSPRDQSRRRLSMAISLPWVIYARNASLKDGEYSKNIAPCRWRMASSRAEAVNNID
jgi:hypothetical protein